MTLITFQKRHFYYSELFIYLFVLLQCICSGSMLRLFHCDNQFSPHELALLQSELKKGMILLISVHVPLAHLSYAFVSHLFAGGTSALDMWGFYQAVVSS